jgi:hypothetical protein
MKSIFLGNLENKISIKEALFILEVERKVLKNKRVSNQDRLKRKEILKRVD